VTTAAFGAVNVIYVVVVVAAYKTLVAFAFLFAAGTIGFGHVSGLIADGYPQYPPYISRTAF